MPKTYTDLAATPVANLDGLAADSYWVSREFNNSSDSADSIYFDVKIVTTATAGVSGGIKLLVSESNDGISYSGGITTQSDATYIPIGDDISELYRAGYLKYSAETVVRELNKLVKYNEPAKYYKIVLFNDTGTALSSTANSILAIKVTN